MHDRTTNRRTFDAAFKWLAQYNAEQADQAGIYKPLTRDQQRTGELERECQRLREDACI